MKKKIEERFSYFDATNAKNTKLLFSSKK